MDIAPRGYYSPPSYEFNNFIKGPNRADIVDIQSPTPDKNEKNNTKKQKQNFLYKRKGQAVTRLKKKKRGVFSIPSDVLGLEMRAEIVRTIVPRAA